MTRRWRVAAVILLPATLTSPPTTAWAGTLQVGEALPAVTLTDWSGRATPLASVRGTVTIIDFWATWCIACRTLLPQLEAMRRDYAPRGLVIAAINIDRAQPPADRFLSERIPGCTLTLLRDPDGVLLARFGAAGMPALYVVDRAGIVRMVKAGYTQEELGAVRTQVEELLNEEPPPTPGAHTHSPAGVPEIPAP